MKRIILIVIIMFFILCIPNCSNAAFYIPGDRSLRGIYNAMRDNPSGWLNASTAGIGGTNWSGEPIASSANGYGKSIVWSMGASCNGHGSSKLTSSTLRTVKVYDVDKNTKNEKLRYLAYAILYSWRHNEYNQSTADCPESFRGKWAINNWVHRNGSGTAQMIGTGVCPYDSNYGGMTIGGIKYKNAKEFATNVGGLELDEKKMQQDEKEGKSLSMEVTEKNGVADKTCTIIGPYHIEVKR